MGICQWGLILVTVALLLDPTFADVLVQPGYGQPGNVQKNPRVSQSQSPKDQRIGNPQENYQPQQNYSPQSKNYPQQPSPIQLLQQQHAYQQQYLQHQHQQEHQQLLQMQKQQLQDPALQQYQTGGNEVVGMPYGIPRYPSILPGPLGGLSGGRLFSLGPLGLNSFTLGGLGGLVPPLLLSPHQPTQMTGSSQYEKSVDGPTQPRARREIRDPGESSGRKYRQKNTRIQQDGVATNPSLKSKLDTTSPNTQTSKSNDETVGSRHKENEENVGSSLLDPLGLVDKTEDFIDDLKSGHLPNPLNWLNKEKPTGNSQFEEHVVGQSQQYQYPQQQGKSNNEYNAMNQQTEQSMGPVVGDRRQRPCPYFGHHPPLGPFGSYPPPYAWRQSNFMNNQANRMAYPGNPMTGASNQAAQQFTSQTTPWGNNPMPLSQNSGTSSPSEKSFAANSNAYQQIIGAQNPAMTKAQMTPQKTGGSGQPSPMNSMGNDPIIGAPNPSQLPPSQDSWGNPTGYNQMIGNPQNQMDNFYRSANSGQPMYGTLYDPVTGSAGPAALNGGAMPYISKTVGGPGSMGGQTPMVGNPLINNFYDPRNRQNYYYGSNGGSQRHRQSPYDFDDIFDDDYHHHHHGGFNRIYEAVVDGLPFGFGDVNSHYMNNHHYHY